MLRPQRVLAIHDMSGVGRCSLTVIIPALSCMGHQVCPVPTAMLSTHLGGFGEVAARDLTDYMPSAYEHYKSLGLDFECIYTGFLSSQSQIDSCLKFFEGFPDALKVVDPVMGDNGRLYVDAKVAGRMKELVLKADVIVPNLTEAQILLGDRVDLSPMSHEDAKRLLSRLSEMGPKMVCITGVSLFGGPNYANLVYDRDKGLFYLVPYDYMPVAYPGTGDLFASVLTGGLLWGESIPMAASRATTFCTSCIKTTYTYKSDTREGVFLEKNLSMLTDRSIFSSFQLL